MASPAPVPKARAVPSSRMTRLLFSTSAASALNIGRVEIDVIIAAKINFIFKKVEKRLRTLPGDTGLLSYACMNMDEFKGRNGQIK